MVTRYSSWVLLCTQFPLHFAGDEEDSDIVFGRTHLERLSAMSYVFFPEGPHDLRGLRRSLSSGSPTTFAEGGFYAYLRSRVRDSVTGNKVFDYGRFWSRDLCCIDAGGVVNVVVYFLFEDDNELSRCWEQLESKLAIDANVYYDARRESPDGSTFNGACLALIFSGLSPLAGPMTYAEVERAVEHYLGWCSGLPESSGRWRKADRVTIELVPTSDLESWTTARVDGLECVSAKGLFPGHGFGCERACSS